MVVLKSIKSLSNILKKENPSRVVLITTDFLAEKLSWAVSEIKSLAQAEIILVPNGESAKDWASVDSLIKNFIKAKVSRNSMVIVLGGGATTDMAGFACSIFLRGVPYINIPTTLMGQVDAALGGKTAINFSGYKNQIGTFYDPVAVIIDSRFIKGLSRDQMIDGLAEIIKEGLVKDKSILEMIRSHSIDELKNSSVIEKIINKSIKVKQYFVKKDLKDKDVRQILNFGHTVGHALELKYNLSHGKAVLIGMVEELKIGEKIKITSPEARKYLETIYEKLGIMAEIKNYKIDSEAIKHDKKVLKSEINFPVVIKPGKAKLIKISLDKII